MIKIAMKKIDDYIKEKNLEAHLVLQVHDELVYEIKNLFLEDAAKKFKEIMETILTSEVPILVQTMAGEDWGNMQKI